MNPKSAAVGLIVLAGLGAALWWRSKDDPGHTAGPQGPGGAAATSGKASDKASGGAATGLESPQAPTQTPADGTRKEEAPPPEPALELVSPLLELPLIVDGASGEVSAEGSSGAVDELLQGRHGTKNRAQLELSWRSIRFVLDQQKDANVLPKEQILSAEAVRALEIEAAWLKERIYN